MLSSLKELVEIKHKLMYGFFLFLTIYKMQGILKVSFLPIQNLCRLLSSRTLFRNPFLLATVGIAQHSGLQG